MESVANERARDTAYGHCFYDKPTRGLELEYDLLGP